MKESNLLIHSEKTEQELIGSVIVTPSNYLEVNFIRPKHFYDVKHTRIWEVIEDMFTRNVVPELTTLMNELNKKGYLKDGVDPVYLTQLAGVGVTMNHKQHAQHIYDLSKKRETAVLLNKGLNYIDETADIKTVVDRINLRLTDMFSDLEEDRMNTAKYLVSEAREVILSRKYGESMPRLIHSGLSSFQIPNGMIIIAARPSMGKSSFCIQLCNNIAVNKKIPMALFELEMSSEQVLRWMIAQRTEIANERLITGKITDQEEKHMENHIKAIEDAPLWVDDSPGLNIMQLRAKALHLKRAHDIQVIIIDYLQLMSGVTSQGKIKNRENEVSEISRQLKILSKELDIPVIAVCQINREVEHRADKLPKLSDLRESGSLEQDADMVGFLYRAEYYGIDRFEDGSSTEGVAQLLIEKYRDGKLGTFDMKFMPNQVTFKTLPIG